MEQQITESEACPERFIDHAVAKRHGRRDRKAWKHPNSSFDSEIKELPEPRTMWMTFGQYEHEVTELGFGGPMVFTGWTRCAYGRNSNGEWWAWHSMTGQQKLT